MGPSSAARPGTESQSIGPTILSDCTHRCEAGKGARASSKSHGECDRWSFTSRHGSCRGMQLSAILIFDADAMESGHIRPFGRPCVLRGRWRDGPRLNTVFC